MGSISDWETMREACLILEELDIAFEKRVVSAHRTPDEMFIYAQEAQGRGIEVIIAGAGGQPTCRVWWQLKPTCRLSGCP